jgi:hypothetical protein
MARLPMPVPKNTASGIARIEALHKDCDARFNRACTERTKFFKAAAPFALNDKAVLAAATRAMEKSAPFHLRP